MYLDHKSIIIQEFDKWMKLEEATGTVILEKFLDNSDKY